MRQMNFCFLLVYALESDRIAQGDKMGYSLGNALSDPGACDLRSTCHAFLELDQQRRRRQPTQRYAFPPAALQPGAVGWRGVGKSER